MPGMDGTGPRGMGSMTGRGMGYCSSRLSGRGVKPFYGGGTRIGRGYGRGLGRCLSSYVPYETNSAYKNTDEEKYFLEHEKKILEARLKDISDALKSYDNTSEDK